MASMRIRQKPKFGMAISGIVTLVLLFLVGGKVFGAVADVVANETTPFCDAYNLLGFTCTDPTNGPTGAVTTTGLIGVIGVVAAASVVLAFVKVKF